MFANSPDSTDTYGYVQITAVVSLVDWLVEVVVVVVVVVLVVGVVDFGGWILRSDGVGG